MAVALAFAWSIGLYLGVAIMALVAGHFVTFGIAGSCALALSALAVWWVVQ